MRILIVEDEAISAHDLVTTVESFNHVVVGIVGSGAAALESVTTTHPDLALIDIELSGPLDGITTAQCLAAQFKLPVIYLIAHSDSATLFRASATMPVGYLLKPFNERTIWAILTVAGHQIQQQRQAESALRASHDRLAAALAAQERRAAELTALSQMSGALMRCTVIEDGYILVTRAARQLFPEVAGALFVPRPASSELEAVIAWGEIEHSYPPLTQRSCRALSQRSIILGGTSCGGCRCDSIPPNFSREALCVPLIAEEEILGVLHIHLPLSDLATDTITTRHELAMVFAEQAAIGLANVRLRAVLRDQAVRDPLTGLFNRRFMEETLARELHRAARQHYPVGVIMLDVDHFKQVNDTYGHNVGDHVLRMLGQLLLTMVRLGDVVCRYGGEEFVLILPATPLEVVVMRAEQIRRAVRTMVLDLPTLSLPPISVSLGVTVLSEAEGAGMAAGLQRADTALYAAKRAGRDRVEILVPDALAVE